MISLRIFAGSENRGDSYTFFLIAQVKFTQFGEDFFENAQKNL